MENSKIERRGFKPVSTEHLKVYNSVEEVIMPQRGTRYSAGYDFFAVEDLIIMPNSSVSFWTDIKAYMLEDEVLEFYPRGSIGNKHTIKLGNTVGIVDSDYYNNEQNDGNIKLTLWNYGSKVREFKKGSAVVQAIFKKFLVADNCNTNTIRKGGQGHTSNKGDSI